MGYIEQEKQPPVTVTGKILRETAAAILIEVEGTGIWFPLSQVHSIHRTETIDQYASYIVVEYWIAAKKGVA